MKTTSTLMFITIILFFSKYTYPQDPNNLSRSTNKFAFRLYDEILEKEDSNLFFSPIGLSTAFAQVYIGSENNTKNEIASVFGFNDSIVGISNFYDSIFLSDTNNPNVLLNANSIWVNSKFELKPEFVKSLEDNFNSKVFTLDVSKPSECADQVNSWVKNSTLDKINNIISENNIEIKTVFLLLNSLYFKDKWLNTFDENNTREDMFNVSASEKVRTEMMNTTGLFNYAKYQNFEVLKIPYSTNNYSMLVLLPKDVSGIYELEQNISSIDLEFILSDLKKNLINISLPKFKFEYEVKYLKEILTRLGVKLAFEKGKAEFGGIIKEVSGLNIFISEVLQKTFVDVNEDGTEAAATTMIKENYFFRSSRPDPIFFKADHPFLFFIIENNTKCILFMGRCVNPAE